MAGEIVSVNPTIEVQTLTNPDTEYTYNIPANTVRFNLLGNAQFTFAIASGGSVITVEAASGGWTENVKGRTVVLPIYLQSSFAGTVVRIISWQA